MNNTALIYDTLILNWYGIIVAAACFVGLLTACILRKLQRGSICDVLAVFCIGTPLAILLSRALYCICTDNNSGESAVKYFFSGMLRGGYGHYGAMIGVLIAVVAVSLIFKLNCGELSDCIAVVGAGIIAAGRFANDFCRSEIGWEIAPNKYTVADLTDGAARLAVYKLDGMVESVICVICLVWFMAAYIPKKAKYTKGNIALIFFSLHGLNQVVMDSLCDESLYLFNNPFVRVSQIFGILSWLGIIVYLIIRMIMKKSFKKAYWFIAAAFIPLVAIGVKMQWRMGRANYISGRKIMGVCMALIGLLSLLMFIFSEFVADEKKEPRKKAYFGLINNTLDDGLEDDFDLPQTQTAIQAFIKNEEAQENTRREYAVRAESQENVRRSTADVEAERIAQRDAHRRAAAESQRIAQENARRQAAENAKKQARDSERRQEVLRQQGRIPRPDKEIYSSYATFQNDDDDLDYPFPDTCVKQEQKSHRMSQSDLDELRKMFDEMD